MSNPSSLAWRAAVDAADQVTTVSRPHLGAILDAFTGALVRDLYIADRGDGVLAVFDGSRPPGRRCIVGPDTVSEQLWDLLVAVLPTRTT